MDIQEIAAWASLISSGAVCFSAVWIIRHVSRLEHKVDLMWGWFSETFLSPSRWNGEERRQRWTEGNGK